MKLIAECLWKAGCDGRKARSTMTWTVADEDEAREWIRDIEAAVGRALPGHDYVALPGDGAILSSFFDPAELAAMTFRLHDEGAA
jgi:hypothetical protein